MAEIATKNQKNRTSKFGPTYRRRKGYNQAIVTLTDAKTKQRKDYLAW